MRTDFQRMHYQACDTYVMIHATPTMHADFYGMRAARLRNAYLSYIRSARRTQGAVQVRPPRAEALLRRLRARPRPARAEIFSPGAPPQRSSRDS